MASVQLVDTIPIVEDQGPNVQNQENHHQIPWITVGNKKRLRSPEENKPRKQTKMSDYWLQKPIETSNRFDNLNVEEESSQTNVERKPPPVTIYKVGIIEHIHKLLQDITKGQYEIKTVAYETVKVQVHDAESFGKLIKELDSRNTEYHTFRPKSEKSFRFVMRGLHHGTDINSIKEALLELGHEAVNIHNIKHRTTKNPLPLFYIDIKPKENNKEVYSIRNLNNNIVQCEPPHAKRIIPQCTRCQSFGHTKTYCRRAFRCIKCAGYHEAKDCSRKTRDNQVKCVNCNNAHPANYRGCIVHQQLQQRLYPALREKKNPQQLQFISDHQIRPGMTFAQAVNNNNNVQGAQHNPATPTYNQPINNMAKLEEMLSKLMEQMGVMLNLLTTVISKLA